MNYKIIILLVLLVISISGCTKENISSEDNEDTSAISSEKIEEIQINSYEEEVQQSEYVEYEVDEIVDNQIISETVAVEKAEPMVGNWYIDDNGVEWCEIYVEVGNISKEECDYFTEFFQINGGGGFLRCDYNKPQDVDLETVFYGAMVEESNEKELEELGWDYGYIDKLDIDEKLVKFTGMTNEQMTEPLFVKSVDGKEVVVWMHSDWVTNTPVCLGGYKEGDIYTLLMYTPLSVVTLKKSSTGTLEIISNRYLDNHFHYNGESDYSPNELYTEGALDTYIPYTKNELELLKNEYYARHGMIFDDPAMELYFEAMSWYKPSVEKVDFDESVFSEVEKTNMAFIDEKIKEVSMLANE